MIDYDECHWKTECPKVKCKEDPCKCGLKYVHVPAALESTTPPEKGRYSNAIVEYEASGRVYIYSTEGIPVLVKEGDAS